MFFFFKQKTAYEMLRSLVGSEMCIETDTDGGDTLYVMDQISDKKNKEETWVEHLSLSEAMKRLNDRERHIISLRFFEGKTQTEVADIIGISQAQVSRLEKGAINTIKKNI